MVSRTVPVGLAALSVLLSAYAVAATPVAPKPVSPGSQLRQETVAQGCPTFSWSAVPDARSYGLVVYEVRGGVELGDAVIRQHLAAGVSSWTPSLSQGLTPGVSYAWTVGAETGKSEMRWSEPAFFKVTEGVSPAEFEEALRIVRSYLAARDQATGPMPIAEAGESADTQPSEVMKFTGGLAPPPSTQLSVDGTVHATDYSGSGALLTDLDPANLAAGTAAIDISGTATTASNLVGGASVSVSELEFDPTTQAEHDAHAGAADAHRDHATLEESAEIDTDIATHAALANVHHTPPTGLPPTGAAGGELTGTYPNPGVAATIARDSEVTSEISSHAGMANVHHTPTVDTVLTEAQVEGYVTDGPLDMGNNPITNIGAAGTDFTAAGGLTIADDLRINGEGLGIGADRMPGTNANIYLYDGGIYSGPHINVSGHNQASVLLERRRTDGGWYTMKTGCGSVNCAIDFSIFHDSGETCIGIRDGCDVNIPTLEVGTFELNVTDSPGSCDTTTEGRLYYDASQDEPCFCNGSSWTQFDGGGTC